MIAAEGEFDWSGKAPKSLMEDRSIPSAARIGPDMLGYAWDRLGGDSLSGSTKDEDHG